MIVFGLFFFVIATGWTLFSSTYFIIPTFQKVLETNIMTMYIQWPIITLFCAIVGNYHAAAANVRQYMSMVEKRVRKQKIN